MSQSCALRFRSGSAWPTLGTGFFGLIVFAALSFAAPTDAQSSTEVAARIEQALTADPYQGFIKLLDEADRNWSQVLTYKATFHKEERIEGERQPEEVVNYKFMRDHCVKMEWLDNNNKDKKVLYVDGLYDNMLNIQVKVMFVKARVTKAVDDPDVKAKSHHPITDSGFGRSLANIRRLTSELHAKGMVKVQFEGRATGPSGQPCLKITRNFTGGTTLKRSTVLFDMTTLMPVQIEAEDAQGFLEKYTYKNVVLNPKLPNGQPELTVRDFYRSVTFSEDRDWNVPENWTLSRVAPKFVAVNPQYK